MSESYGYSQGRILLENLTSFWTKVFGDSSVIQAHLGAHAETLAQAYFNLLEIILAKSVHDIPVFHREKWTLLTFNESDRNRNSSSLLTYGTPGVVYGEQPADSEVMPGFTYTYGGFVEGPTSSFDLPEGIVNIESYVMNRIHEPSLVYTAGQDFLVKNGVIFFKTNPFENALVPVRDIQDEDGNVIDRQIALWALNSDSDYQFLYENYGKLVGVFFESSENYKQFLQSVFRLYTVGPRIKFLISTLNALLGLSVIKEPVETYVSTQILSDGTKRIITDKNLYDFESNVDLRQDLEEGQTLQAFEHLTEVVTILDNVTNPSWWNNYTFLPIPPEILSGDHQSSLKVFNDITTMEPNWGETVEYHVIGDMTDERQEFYENYPLMWGDDFTWGQDNDIVVQPLNDLFKKYWKYNLFLLYIKVDQIPPGRLTTEVRDLLHEALPAYVHYISILERPIEDEYDLEDDVTDTPTLERAHVYTDVYDGADEGYWGLPRWGMGDVWGDEIEWGTIGFLEGPKFFQTRAPCRI